MADDLVHLVDPEMPASQVRLHFGELSAQELRTARAAMRFANHKADAALARKDAEIAELRVEVERLGGMVYVPGAWSCPKCSLRLLASTLNAIDGSMSSDNKPQACANGCGPMWRVTERDERRDAYATVEQWAQRAERAEARVREALSLLGEARNYLEGLDIADAIDALVLLNTEEAK